MEEKKIELNEIIEIAKKVSELSEAGILNIDTYSAKVQMSDEAFREVFQGRSDIKTEPFSWEIPYEYSVKEQGVKFMCLSRRPLELDKMYR